MANWSPLGKRASFEPLRSINSTIFSGSYQALGSPLANPNCIIKIVNNSTVLVTISFDGTNDHDIIPAGSFVLYDFGTDAESSNSNEKLNLAAGTQVYVKGSAATGLVYLTCIFQGG